jgi:hypothetical protein
MEKDLQKFIEILEGLKIKPHPFRIPCPEGRPGCLVIHWSSDLILTPEEREFNEKIQKAIDQLNEGSLI